MPIPELSTEGWLPPGLHEATLVEVRQRFGRIQRSDVRVHLMRKLEIYAEEVRNSGIGRELLVDGSFVTSKDEPGDVDCILVLEPSVGLQGTLSPATYNIISKRMVRKRHGIDLYAFPAGSASVKSWIELFSQVKGRPDQMKGLVRIPL